jgi:hypothetical protein
MQRYTGPNIHLFLAKNIQTSYLTGIYEKTKLDRMVGIDKDGYHYMREMYTHGDICYDTGAPRRTEIRVLST